MRKDGKKVKNIRPFAKIIPYIMSKTVDAQNAIQQNIDLAPLQEYLKTKRAMGVSHMSLLVTAYIRTVQKYPQLNRFVVNKKIYQRNYFSISFVLMKPTGSNENAETVVKIKFDLSDDIYEVSRKINEAVEANRSTQYDNKTDKLLNFLIGIPLLSSTAVGLIKLLDRYGLLPRSIIDASPFHTSLFLTNLMSIRTNHIFHHIYEFGTTCVFISMGNREKRLELTKEGIAEKTYIPLGVVLDERIASGYEFATFFKTFNRYMNNPALLEEA